MIDSMKIITNIILFIKFFLTFSPIINYYFFVFLLKMISWEIIISLFEHIAFSDGLRGKESYLAPHDLRDHL